MRRGPTVLVCGAVAAAIVFGVSAASAGPIVTAPTLDPPLPANPTTRHDATFTFHDSEPVLRFRCSHNAASYEACTSPKTYTGLDNKQHLFCVEAVASAGVSGPTCYQWLVDSARPKITVAFPVAATRYSPSAWDAGCPLSGQPAGVCGSADDASGVANVAVSLLRDVTGKYWDGSSFASATERFLPATLGSVGSTSTGWSFAVGSSAFTASGRYTVRVQARDGAGNVRILGEGFKIKLPSQSEAKPPPPTIVSQTVEGTKASFAYTDTQAKVTYECRRQPLAATFSVCGKSQSYPNLVSGDYTFCVEAVGLLGQRSDPTCFAWTVGTKFTIDGQPPPGQVLAPGGPVVPIDLVFTNPNSTSLTVTVRTTIRGTGGSPCDVSNFVLVQQLQTSVTIPAASTVSLEDLGVPQADWPELQMIDSGNQDACKGVNVHLRFVGSGTG